MNAVLRVGDCIGVRTLRKLEPSRPTHVEFMLGFDLASRGVANARYRVARPVEVVVNRSALVGGDQRCCSG